MRCQHPLKPAGHDAPRWGSGHHRGVDSGKHAGPSSSGDRRRGGDAVTRTTIRRKPLLPALVTVQERFAGSGATPSAEADKKPSMNPPVLPDGESDPMEAPREP